MSRDELDTLWAKLDKKTRVALLSVGERMLEDSAFRDKTTKASKKGTRPLTGWNLFTKEHSAAAKKALGADAKLKDRTSWIGKKWKALSAEERENWKEKAKSNNSSTGRTGKKKRKTGGGGKRKTGGGGKKRKKTKTLTFEDLDDNTKDRLGESEDEEEEVPQKTPKGKKGSGKKKEGKTKGKSGYQLFMAEKRQDIKDELGPSASFGEVSKEVGRRWKALSSEEQAAYGSSTVQRSTGGRKSRAKKQKAKAKKTPAKAKKTPAKAKRRSRKKEQVSAEEEEEEVPVVEVEEVEEVPVPSKRARRKAAEAAEEVIHEELIDPDATEVEESDEDEDFVPGEESETDQEEEDEYDDDDLLV